RAYPSGRSWGLGTPGAAVLIAAVNRHACLAVPRASPRSRENPHPYRNRDGGPVSLRSDERAMLRDSLRWLLAGPVLSSSGAPAEGEIAPVKPRAGDWTVALPGPGTGRPGAAVVYVVTGGAPLGRCLLVTDREGRAALTVADVPADSAFRTRRVEGVDPW